MDDVQTSDFKSVEAQGDVSTSSVALDHVSTRSSMHKVQPPNRVPLKHALLTLLPEVLNSHPARSADEYAELIMGWHSEVFKGRNDPRKVKISVRIALYNMCKEGSAQKCTATGNSTSG